VRATECSHCSSGTPSSPSFVDSTTWITLWSAAKIVSCTRRLLTHPALTKVETCYVHRTSLSTLFSNAVVLSSLPGMLSAFIVDTRSQHLQSVLYQHLTDNSRSLQKSWLDNLLHLWPLMGVPANRNCPRRSGVTHRRVAVRCEDVLHRQSVNGSFSTTHGSVSRRRYYSLTNYCYFWRLEVSTEELYLLHTMIQDTWTVAHSRKSILEGRRLPWVDDVANGRCLPRCHDRTGSHFVIEDGLWQTLFVCLPIVISTSVPLLRDLIRD